MDQNGNCSCSRTRYQDRIYKKRAFRDQGVTQAIYFQNQQRVYHKNRWKHWMYNRGFIKPICIQSRGHNLYYGWVKSLYAWCLAWEKHLNRLCLYFCVLRSSVSDFFSSGTGSWDFSLPLYLASWFLVLEFDLHIANIGVLASELFATWEFEHTFIRLTHDYSQVFLPGGLVLLARV